MTKAEFERRIVKEQPKTGELRIFPGEFYPAAAILGCYYNQSEKTWHVYETGDRGNEGTIYRTDSEEEAYDKLYEMVMFEKE